jgi:hypothetical protein
MQQLVDIKYRQQQESFARLLAQESTLRTSLKKLDSHLAGSRRDADPQQQAIGADVVWQSWIGRKKRELNIQLAQVLAVKQRHVAQVQQAYGKVLVTADLCAQADQAVRKKKAQSELDRAIASMLFRGSQ